MYVHLRVQNYSDKKIKWEFSDDLSTWEFNQTENWRFVAILNISWSYRASETRTWWIGIIMKPDFMGFLRWNLFNTMPFFAFFLAKIY